MAATIEVYSYHSAGETATLVTTLNMLGADQAGNASTTTYPVQKPDSGTNYSFERWFKCKVTDLGGLTEVRNFRVYIDDATPDTGNGEVTYYYGQTDTFVTPVETDSSVATTIMPTSLPSENLYIGGSASGSITAINNYTDYGVMQIDVTSSATVESKSPTVTIVWDEVA